MPTTNLTRLPDLEARIRSVGSELDTAFRALLEALPGGLQGPQGMALELGVDKVLMSRLLKGLRGRDPFAMLHSAPGPEPLRRLVRGAQKQVRSRKLASAATSAVDEFERLIKRDFGDRSALTAILATWLPEVREEFELRRKQSAFKALSEIKGTSVDLNMATVCLHPSARESYLDVVWMIGHIGLRRLRPGPVVKVATRRMVDDSSDRRPQTLDGTDVEGIAGGRLDRFCSNPPARLNTHRYGRVLHYSLEGETYGPHSEVDFLFAEVNRAEMPHFVPAGSGRRGYVFAEVSVPARTLVFDVLVHDDVYTAGEPELLVHDTALGGIVDLNDPARELDRLDLIESIQPLGKDFSRLRVPALPQYVDAVHHLFERLEWKESEFRLYRYRVDYPLYGSQISYAFRPPEV